MRLADLPAKDRQLVSEHENLQFLRPLTTAKKNDQLEQAAEHEVDDPTQAKATSKETGSPRLAAPQQAASLTRSSICTPRADRCTVFLVIIDLREARRDERDYLGGLLSEYLFEFDGRVGPYPELDAYWEESERRPFLIEVDGNVVGFCLIQRRDGGWGIREFWVQTGFRRSGVGRRAVDAVAERGRADGARHLEAKVHPDNGESLRFWLAVGFSEVQGPGTGVTVTRRAL